MFRKIRNKMYIKVPSINVIALKKMITDLILLKTLKTRMARKARKTITIFRKLPCRNESRM